MMDLGNCPRCGKLYAKNFRDACPSCIREIDKEYELCSTFLRVNKGAVINDLSDETGVSIKQITKFIREGRISLVNAPNMSYPCEVCGTLIRESHICGTCRTRFIKEAGKLNSPYASKQDDASSTSSAHNAYRIKDR